MTALAARNVSCLRCVHTPRRIMRPRFGFELGLRSKLFLVLLGAILLAAVATSIPVRGALHVRVSGEFDDRALERVRSRLLAAYERHGNWDFLRRDPSRWFNLLRDAAILPPRPFPSIAGPAPKTVVVSVPLALLDGGRRFVIGDSQIGPNAPMRPVITNGQIVGWLAGLRVSPPEASTLSGRVIRCQCGGSWVPEQCWWRHSPQAC